MKNPTQEINISFDDYVRERTERIGRRMEGGVPNYAFASDYALRQKINQIPGVFTVFKALTSHMVPVMRQKFMREATRVTPNQFPKIFAMTKDCSEMLGIGLPTVYVQPEIGQLNAFAMAIEDSEPLVILYSSLVERTTDQELKAVIGHECGHVHNNHGIYNLIVEILVNGVGVNLPGVGDILRLLTAPIQIAIRTWGRAAEITCDRAGIICCGEADSTISVHGKFQSGGLLSGQAINVDELLTQYEAMRETPVRLQELVSTHPAGVRRILAAREFVHSEPFYSWHPEMKTPGMRLYTKEELDSRCKRYVDVMKGGK
ncbi:MAG: M48 family metallopeptidase [Bacillota bacterium]|nr:M48 family metallopeptidase [Bacillota bacterium]